MAKKREPKPVKCSWIVRMKCTVVKEVVCDDCTEEEAREHPYDHAVGDEDEVEQTDYDVISVEPND